MPAEAAPSAPRIVGPSFGCVQHREPSRSCPTSSDATHDPSDNSFTQLPPAVATLLNLARKRSPPHGDERPDQSRHQLTSPITTSLPCIHLTRLLNAKGAECTRSDIMDLSRHSPEVLRRKPFKKLGFLSLPAETRNTIYELAYADMPSDAEKRPIRLIQACPPSKSLRLACKKVSDEAWPFYRQAYQQYWINSSFRLSWPSDDALPLPSHIKDNDVAHVRNLTMFTTWSNLKSRVATLQQEMWLWWLCPESNSLIWFDYHEDGKWVSRDASRSEAGILPGNWSWKVVVLGVTHSAVVNVTITRPSTVHLYQGVNQLTVAQLRALEGCR